MGFTLVSFHAHPDDEALLTGGTLARAAAAGLPGLRQLDAHDAWGLFDAIGDLVVTGPTRTNVNDYRAILIL